MKRKSFLALLLAVFALTVFSCDTWMQNDDLYSDIAYDVKVANAQKINVFVRCAATAQGVTSPNGYTTFKVGIPQEVSVVTETGYGFIRWAAFSTNDYPAGAQHRTLLYVDDEDYDTNFSQTEIKSPVVTFADPYNPSTTVTVNASRNDVFIIPLVTARPEMGLSIPSNGEKDVARNMSIRISFSKPMDPLSFADAVSITEGSLTLVGGEVEISSKDISNLFEEPALSKSGKTLTLKFTPEGQKIGYNPKTTVNIIVSKQVKDIYGFSMVQDGSLSFTAGQTMDTWAPRITQLTGGKDLAFGKFQGMYKDPETQNTLKNKNLTRIIITSGSDTAANITNLSNSFYSASQNGSQPFINNRVKDKVTLRVFAEDLTQTNDGHVENDVDMISIRSRTLFDINGGSISNPEWNYSSMAYIPQGYVTKDGVDNKKDYNALITAANENNVFGNNGNEVGCILIYDIIDEDYITSLPDGLVQIDVAAVDNVSNEGFYEDAETMKNQGNGWATLFIVKDTTPPVGIYDSGIDLKLKAAGTANDQTVSWSNYYNKTDFESLKISLTSTVQNDIYDPGDSKLNSKKSDIKWTIIPIADDVTDDVAKELLSAPEVSWKALSDSFTGFTAPTQDNANGQKFAYGIKDDMDNINAIILGKTVKYDCTEPEIGELTWTADSGVVAGISTGTVLSNQLLEIPVTDETSKLKTIEILVKHVNANGEEEEAYASPFASTSDLKIYKNNTGTQFSASEYTINGKKLSLNSTYNDIEKILIKGIKIADAAVEGNYRVYVKAYDNAGNVSLSAPIDLSNDSTAPVIEKIVVPGLKKAVDYSNNNSVLYWTPSRSTSTDVYVYFTETNSGAKIFDFAGSTIKLTSTSQISIDNGAPLAETEYTKDTTNNKLTFKTPIKGTSKKLTITNAQINTSTSGSTLNLVITDLATKASDQAVTLQNDTGTLTGITAFYYENEDPVINSVTLTGNSDAESGYTKTKSITAELYVTAKKSGVQIIKVSDNAKFDNTTTVKAGSTTIPATISADGSSLTLDADKVIRDSSYSFIITLTNVKLTSGDGDKKVTFNVKTLAERESTSMSSSIKLDTVKPQWKGKGLYSGATSTSYYYKIYPHPISNGKAYGVDFGEYNNVTGNDQARKILYFYDGGSYIKIFADVEDDNLKSELFWKNENDSNVTAGVYQNANNGWKGHNQVYAMDKAGNKSDVIDYYYIKVSNLVTTDNSRKNIEKLEHDVELIVPADMDPIKNTFLNGVRSRQDWKIDYDFWGSSKTDSPLWAFVYVLKATDGSYKLKIPVNEYVDVDKNSAPIEKYGVTHLYNHFPSAKAASYGTDGFEPRSPNWHEYPETLPAVNTTTQSVNDGDLNTCVDSEGNIIVTLPDHNCPPISLWLMDGCGNEKYILLNPGLKTKLGRDLTFDNEKYNSRNEAVSWEFDGRVGVNDTYAGTAYSPNLTDTTVTPNNTDTVFYKKVNNIAPYLQLKNFSDSCRFIPDTASYSSINGVKSGNADFENDPWNYSIRSRIILWKDSSAPTQADFNSSSLVEGETASAWSGYKEFYDEIDKGSSNFNLPDIAFPIYDPVDANGIHTTTSPYELWYIIEDRVGNCTITKLSKGSLSNWMYDVTPPTVEVTTPVKVNHIADDNKNYYSTNSSVNFKITDNQSGIRNTGSDTDLSYTPLIKTYEPEEGYSLATVNPDSNGKISIDGVVDWAGNLSASKGLEYKNSTYWVKLSKPNPSVTLSFTPYKISGTQNSGADSDLRTAGNRNITIDANNPYSFKAMSEVVKVTVTFNVGTIDAANLLGWVISDSTINDYESKFYPADSTEIKQNLVFEKKKNGKWDKNTSWDRSVKYCYPVNKAGMVGVPITVIMELNEKPMLKAGTSLSYTSDSSFVSYSNTTTGEKINFIQSGAEVGFTSNIAVTTAKIVVYDPNDTDTELATLETSLTASDTCEYTAELLTFKDENNKTLSYYLGTPRVLKFMISTASENSDQISLSYPVSNGFNKWAYDVTPPAFSFDSSATEGFVPVSSIYFFKSDNPKLAFSIKDSNNNKTKDIKGYEYKIGSEGNWTEVPATAITSPGNQDTDCTVKIALNSLKTMGEGTAYTFYFRAVDKAGNVSSDSGETVTVQKDTTAPEVSLNYELKKGSDATSNSYYRATDDTESNTITIIYNPSYLNTVVFTPNITDTASGPNGNLYYKLNDGETALMTNKTISLAENTGTANYKIYAKDKVGNETLIKTFVFKLNKPAPSKIVEVTYNNENLPHVSDDSYSTTYTPKVIGVDGGGNAVVMPASADFKITMNAATVLDNSLSYAVEYIPHSGNLPALTVPSSDWKNASMTDGKISVTIEGRKLTSEKNYIFIWLKDVLGNTSVYGLAYEGSASWQSGWWTPDLTGPTATVSLEFPGNTNGTYTSSSTTNELETYIYNSNKISKVKVNGASSLADAGLGITNKFLYYRESGATNSTQIGNTAIDLSAFEDDKTYQIFAKDDGGNETVFKTLKFVADGTVEEVTYTYEFIKEGESDIANYYTVATPDENGIIVIKYNPDKLNGGTFNVTTTCSESVTLKKIVNNKGETGFDGTIGLSLTNGNSVPIILKAYDSLLNETIYAKITFTADNTIGVTDPNNNGGGNTNPNPNIAASAFDGLSPAWIGAINTAGVMGTSSSSTISALSASIASGGLSTNVNTKLTPNAATKTPSVKKTKKAAEKALKKAAKETAAVAKTSANVVEEAPLVQEIASQIEDLGIKDAFVDSVVLEDLPLSEQIIKEDISQVTAKTDFVMSPIEKVEIADTIESAASSAEQAQPEKSSSKAALIVVMLAILSAVASLLVTLKKKRA